MYDYAFCPNIIWMFINYILLHFKNILVNLIVFENNSNYYLLFHLLIVKIRSTWITILLDKSYEI